MTCVNHEYHYNHSKLTQRSRLTLLDCDEVRGEDGACEEAGVDDGALDGVEQAQRRVVHPLLLLRGVEEWSELRLAVRRVSMTKGHLNTRTSYKETETNTT